MSATKENFWSFESEHGHEVVYLPVKIVSVDKGIVPVFEWLNSKLEVFTLWSCQGERHWFCDEINDYTIVYTYVAFLCRRQDVFKEIKQCVDCFSEKYKESETNLELDHDMFNLWLHPDYLLRFIDHIKEYEEHGNESVRHTGSVDNIKDEGAV